MAMTDSEIIEKTLELIVNIVVQVDGRNVLTGDLIERKETHRYWSNREAQAAAEAYRIAAKAYYEPKIRANIPEFKELIRQHNESSTQHSR